MATYPPNDYLPILTPTSHSSILTFLIHSSKALLFSSEPFLDDLDVGHPLNFSSDHDGDVSATKMIHSLNMPATTPREPRQEGLRFVPKDAIAMVEDSGEEAEVWVLSVVNVEDDGRRPEERVDVMRWRNVHGEWEFVGSKDLLEVMELGHDD